MKHQMPLIPLSVLWSASFMVRYLGEAHSWGPSMSSDSALGQGNALCGSTLEDEPQADIGSPSRTHHQVLTARHIVIRLTESRPYHCLFDLGSDSLFHSVQSILNSFHLNTILTALKVLLK